MRPNVLLKYARGGLAGVSVLIALLLVGAAVGQPWPALLEDLGLGLLLLAAALGLATQHYSERRISRDIRQRVGSVVTRVDEVRQKQSRHEYRQQVALDRIEHAVKAIRADVEGQSWVTFARQARELRFEPPLDNLTRVLFVTSNGGGLGHLTRCLAVASHNKDKISAAIVTLSTAYELVKSLGYDVEYVHGPTSNARPWSEWHRQLSRVLQSLLVANRVDVVVFDGTWVYRGVTEVCDRLNLPLIWLCRGTWREDADRTQLSAPLRHCDRMLVPEDVSGAIPDIDSSAPWVTVCPPITITDRSTALPREQACASLGLDPERRYVLIQVGGGNLRDVSEVEIAAVSAVRQLGRSLVPVVVESPMSTHAPYAGDGLISLHDVYPLANHLRAFDFAVSGGGYNTVHENLAVGLPAIYVPSASTTTDDQLARVDELARQGLGLVARTKGEISEAVAALGREGALGAVHRRIASRRQGNGAGAAGMAIVSMAGNRS